MVLYVPDRTCALHRVHLTDGCVLLQQSTQAILNAPEKKKDANAPQPTPLEKHLKDATGPVRPDGSDKFFGFENVRLPTV